MTGSGSLQILMIKRSGYNIFIHFRLRVHIFEFVHSLIKNDLQFASTRNNALSTRKQLLLTLRFYATGSFLSVCGDFIGISKPTASRVVEKVSRILAKLSKLFIKFPDNLNENVLHFHQISRFPRVVGCIDCTHIKIQSPGGNDAEYFRNRKEYFSINVQTVSDHRLRVMDIVARWPGSSHDATIFNNSRLKHRFEEGDFGNCVLLGDSGYPLKKYLLTPIRRFPVLSLTCRLKIKTVLNLIVACAVFHNIAIDKNDIAEEVNIQENQDTDPINLNINQKETQFIRNGFINYFNELLH